MPIQPSALYCGADGKMSPNRAELMQPYVQVVGLDRAEPLPNGKDGMAFVPFTRQWTSPCNDPSSFLYYSKNNKKDKRPRLNGFTPLMPGQYRIRMQVTGDARQVTGMAWFGPKAHVYFKESENNVAFNQTASETLLAESKNRLWRRDVCSFREIRQIYVNVKVEPNEKGVLPDLYACFCFMTTPRSMHNTGVFSRFDVREPVNEPHIPHPWLAIEAENDERKEKKKSQFEKVWDKRDLTTDLTLVVKCDNTRIPVHRCIMVASSQIFEQFLYPGGFRTEAALLKNELEVEKGSGATWKLIVSCIYTHRLFEITPEAMVLPGDFLMALDCMEYYCMPEVLKQIVMDDLKVTLKTSIPIMVYAWRQGKMTVAMEKVIEFVEANVGRLTMSMLPHENGWVNIFQHLKSQNKQLIKVLNREKEGVVDWNAEVGPHWKMTICGFYDQKKQMEAEAAAAAALTELAATGPDADGGNKKRPRSSEEGAAAMAVEEEGV